LAHESIPCLRITSQHSSTIFIASSRKDALIPKGIEIEFGKIGLHNFDP
jgi:hypothetical protein